MGIWANFGTDAYVFVLRIWDGALRTVP